MLRFRHPFKKLRLIALSKVEMRGLHEDLCANWMLFALFQTVCMKNAVCVVA